LACPHWQQIVAENGNKLLPFSATICCRFWKQFVAVFGNKVSVSSNNLLPKMATKLPVWTGLNAAVFWKFWF